MEGVALFELLAALAVVTVGAAVDVVLYCQCMFLSSSAIPPALPALPLQVSIDIFFRMMHPSLPAISAPSCSVGHPMVPTTDAFM